MISSTGFSFRFFLFHSWDLRSSFQRLASPGILDVLTLSIFLSFLATS